MRIVNRDRIVTCDNCGKMIEFDQFDIINRGNKNYITCLNCKHKFEVLYDQTHVYPDDFCSFKTGVNIDNKTINEWIKDGLNILKRNSDDTYHLNASGDTVVTCYSMDDCYMVHVSKGYSELILDKDIGDYNDFE